MMQSQTRRFTYEYRFVPDTLQKDTVRSEFVNLDVEKDFSIYYGQVKFQEDSINFNSIILQKKITPGSYSIDSHSKEWNTSDTVKKNYPDYNTEWTTNIEGDQFLVKEKPLQNWKIIEEKIKIGNFECQKAEAEFGGRIWTAWFTPEIQIPDGPYKFHGLPGLIVALEDHSKTHSFLLRGIKNLKPEDMTWEDLEKLRIEAYGSAFKPININRKQFQKAWSDYRKDPLKGLKQQLSHPGFSMTIRTPDGKEYSDPNEIIRFRESRIREQLKKDNNRIEPDLYQ